MKTIIVKDKTHQKLMRMKKSAQHHSLDEVIMSMYDELM
jgi:predicted CopG family antitoxin